MVNGAAQPDLFLARMTCLVDPTRLRLLRLLERHELGVVELCEVLQLPQSTISRHLKVLTDQGYLQSHRQATTHLYRMVLDEVEPSARRLWLLAREQVEGWPAARQDALRLDRRLKDRRSAAQQFFAGAAGQWDKLRRELYGSEFARAAMLALLPPHSIVADLGCGTGQITAELAEYVRQVIGVDNSPAMLRAAQRRTEGLENVQLRRGELESLPIEEGSCDAAMLVLALSYVVDPVTVLREAARILKSGGTVVVVDLLPHDRDDFRRQLGQQCNGFELGQIRQWMESGGMQVRTARPIAPEPQARGPALFLAVASKPK